MINLSNDPAIALREISAFLEGMSIDTEHEVTHNGTVVGYCLPIEYLDTLLSIRRQIDGIAKVPLHVTQQEAIATIQAIIRHRGYERAMIDRDGGINLLTLNERHARLSIDWIFDKFVARFQRDKYQDVEAVADELGITEQELEAIHRFANQMFALGYYAAITAKRKGKKGGDPHDSK